MRFAVCDDEPLFAYKLEQMANDFFKGRQEDITLATFTDPETFLKSGLESYDAIFLDVLMGSANGMELAQKVRAVNADAVLVFVSAFVEYAPKGFKVNAFRYLLKKDLEQSFPACMRDVLAKLSSQARTFQFRTTEGETKIVRLYGILFFESFSHNVLIHLSGTFYKTYHQLSGLEAQLPAEDFLRIQRSYIVNMRQVSNIKGCEVLLTNGKTLVCSRQKREAALRRYLEIQGE